MMGLTQKQSELLDFIKAYIAAKSIAPSFEQMMEHVGLKSKNGVHRLLTALEERGLIKRLPNRARAIEVLDFTQSKSTVLVPINREIYARAWIVAGQRGEQVNSYIEGAVNAFVEVDGE